MDRKEAKEYLPIMQAFAEGKKIETRYDIYDWTETEVLHLESNNEYRIKPEPKYRPFKTAEECWNEISQHSFPQFLLRKEDKLIMTIGYIGIAGITLNQVNNRCSFQRMFNEFTFTDGEPFGIKEE